MTRAKNEYEQLSKTPKEYFQLLKQIQDMWETQPNISDANLKSITVPTWIVDGDHEEGIKIENTVFMASQIPNAGLLILPETSHFAFLQDPKLFNISLRKFLSS